MAYKKSSSRKSSRKSSKRTYKRKSYAKKSSRKSMSRLVKQVIERTAETKTIQRYNLGQNLVPSNAAGFVANIIEIGPGSTMLISQGTGQGQRVGNRIETVSHTFQGTICPLPWNTTTNPNPVPTHVKMWIFYDKTDPTAVPNPIGNAFFQDGSGVVGFANDLTDHWRPVNTDRYRVLHERLFKVGFAAYTGTATGTTNQLNNQAFTNNDYKITCEFKINLTKSQLKHIRYNDTNNEPMTRRMFCMFQPVHATGSALQATDIPCTLQYMEDFRFKDI